MSGRLTINRYPGQRIFLAEGITIRVCSVKGGRACISIEAPGVKISWPEKTEDLADREEWGKKK